LKRRKEWRTQALAFALIPLVVAIAVAQNNRPGLDARDFSSAPYRLGERLSYTVSFSNFSVAAHVDMLVGARGTFFEREGIELRAHVETIGVVNAALYAINNDYVSYVDPATGLPFRLRQVIREGTRSTEASGDFNPSITAAQAANSFPGTYDFLSALYRLRALPLAAGATYRFTVQNEATSYEVEAKVSGREVVKTNVGSSNAIVTQLRVPGNRAATDYRVRIYFSDDERHLPLLITAQHPAGEIRAELASAEILTEPLPATGTKPDPSATPAPSPLQGDGARQPTQPGPAPTPAAGANSLPELPFKPGEELNFNFFAGTGSQRVGTASFQVRARARYFNRDGMLLTALMQTSGPGQSLFPVNDQISSYVDATTLLPFRTELRLQEGRRRVSWNVSVEQDRGTALFDDGSRVEMPVATHDLLSVFYALRSYDLSVGRQTRVSLLINKRPRLLIVTALGNETIELNGQRIPAVQLALTTSDPQASRLSLRLWVSTDRRRLPLRLTAQTPLGPVRADLAIIPVDLQ
jgi:hypothetical protein